MAKKTTTKKKSSAKAQKVASLRHTKATRTNIPTEELRDFVRKDENAPRKQLYPRDASLDPQLVWQGKDEQDREDLSVPVVPIYIQEKIHPQALIDDLRRSLPSPSGRGAGGEGTAAGAYPSPPGRGQGEGTSSQVQPNLFADFNGLPEDFHERIDFYHHDAHWSNRMILGDSLMVMTSLAEKENLKGKVQTIYLDPPYGIKFGSNWQVSTRKRDVKDGKAEDATRQPEQVRAFRDTWQLGIHSYLAYLRDRLTVARDLLTETGSIFVQIGDENVHLVRCVMDEVFGSENFVSQIAFAKTTGSTRDFIGGTCDYLMFYAKNKEQLKFRAPYIEKTVQSEIGGPYSLLCLKDGQRRRMTAQEKANPLLIPDQACVYRMDNLQSQSMGREKGEGASCWFPVKFNGKEWLPNTRSRWKTNERGMAALKAAGRLEATNTGLYYVRYIDDFPAMPIADLWSDTVVAGFASDKKYVVETSIKVVQRCLLMTTDPGDLVLDPTCGSGTTAHVAEQWGRRWITCDTSRVALALARTRLMAAKFPYYHLAEDYPRITPESTDEEIKYVLKNSPASRAVPGPGVGAGRVDTPARGEGAGRVDTPARSDDADIRKGFVYHRVPHVTLKSIANNPDIKEGMTRKQIDAAIAKHADTETLYDQPYVDNKTVRVAGPFTVESLSPHRTISVEDKKELADTPNEDGFTVKMLAGDAFSNTILDYLRKTPIQTGRKDERLKLESVEVYAGQWINGEARYTEHPHPSRLAGDAQRPHPEAQGEMHPHPGRLAGDAQRPHPEAQGVEKRVAITIGPEYGTVEPGLVKEAAKEAVQGVGFDLLLVCGLAFDPHVGEEVKRYGNLTVLPVRMNPDLSMGDDLLKKTGAGNLFMVFGEPDVEIREEGAEGQRDQGAKGEEGAKGEDKDRIVVEVKGVDVYDPTTGAIRSSSTDDIACWFIDTDYNNESFFVRHAYFTGADEPYKRLRKALKAEIDEAAWSSLYSTVSRAFEKPKGTEERKPMIAVKVINHYGDEVLKVFEV